MKKFIYAFLLLLSACSPKAETIVGKVFHLVEPAQPMKITLAFEADGRFGGKAANSYFGVYKITNQQITLDLQGHTMMMAPPPQMEAEDHFFKVLRQVTTFELKDNRLILNADKPYIFEISDTN